MHKAISKLRSEPLIINNTYLYFNMHLIMQVYYGCRVISLTLKQEKILMQISKETLLRKVGLSKKIPRKILHAKKIAIRSMNSKAECKINYFAFKTLLRTLEK